MSISGTFYFRPTEGELVSADYTPAGQEQSILCGRLTDGEGAPVSDAAVLLFSDSMEVPALIGRTVTDREGHFIFGPLECGALYIVKVFKNELQERHLEIKTV